MATVLIVDDLAEHRVFLGEVVRRAGHAVLEAADGAEALEVVRRERPALVITDILMETMDGVQFVRQLRNEPAVADTRVVFCSSAYHHAEMENLRVSLGVHAVLYKPVSLANLRTLLFETLGAPAPAASSGSGPVLAPGSFELLVARSGTGAGAVAASNRRLLDVIALAGRLSRTLDPRGVLEALARDARQIVGARASVACVLTDDRAGHRAHAASGLAAAAASSLAGAPSSSDLLAGLAGGRAGAGVRASSSGELGDLPAELGPASSFLGVPMSSPAFPHGVLYFVDRMGDSGFDEADEQLAALLAAHGAAAYEKSMLVEEARRRARDMSAMSQRLVQVQEDERRRLARELHDEVGQLLTGFKLQLEGVCRRRPEAAADLAPVLDGVKDLIGRTRDLSLDLRPAILDDFGLVPALLWLIGRFREHTGIAVRFDHSGLDGRLPGAIETCAYRIIQEALTNVARHAGVTQAIASAVRRGATVELTISDQGRGFDAASAGRHSTGLAGMAERARLTGGRFTIESDPGQGTHVRATLPLGEDER